MKSAQALFLLALSVPAHPAEPGSQLTLRGSPPEAARCFTQKAQRQGHATKTTDPDRGDTKVVVYADKSEKQEIATLHITGGTQGSRVTVESQGSAGKNTDTIKRLMSGC